MAVELRKVGPMSSPTSLPSPDLPVPTLQAVALTTTVRQHLTPAFIREALGSNLAAYRARVLTIEVVVLCVLELLLRGLPSLAALVRRLQLGKLTSVAALRVSTQAFYQRLAAIPHTVFLQLLQHVVQALQPDVVSREDRRRLAPFANAIVALDDTTLDALAHKSEAFARVGTGKLEALAGRLGCAVDLVTGLFRAVAYDSDSGSNERHRLIPLVQTLPAGALVVFDLGYFAFDLFDALGEHFVYFVTRLKKQVQYRVVHTMVDSPLYRDQLVWLGGDSSTEAMRWPVRLLEVHVGQEWWSYVTNVWDPQMLGPDRVLRLYEARWSIERAFYAIKRALGLHTLYLCKLNGLLIQIWCTLLLYQLLQTLRTTVAQRLKWDTEDVSWAKLMEALTLYAEQPPAQPLLAWLQGHAAILELRVRQSERRKRIHLDAALREDFQSTVDPIPLASIQPQRPRRRPPRPYRLRRSERVFAVILQE